MVFPFTAIVGQDEMKLGLILNVIDPSIGGLLIMGEKGTGKSTAVRALAELLPEIRVVKGCRFNCDPSGDLCSECREKKERGEVLEVEKKKMRVVELPLSITEDRLVGTLDVEHAIKYGEKRFEPGILADANRNFLYVDEVNLLEDHIVDLLLDSAAMGINTVEREGVSFSHPARFILVGTMNPEEGDLRPQLLDRFGLSVIVEALTDKEKRIEIIRRREEFDKNPRKFMRKWSKAQRELARRISAARRRLKGVVMDDSIFDTIATIATSLRLDGHRAEITMMRAAKALAAFRGRKMVLKEDVRSIAPLALNHRLKRLPFEDIGGERERMKEVLQVV